MRLQSRKPFHFYQLLNDRIGDDESIGLKFMGLQGLVAETTDNNSIPEATEHQERVSKSALLTVVRVIVALMNRQPVKLVAKPKTWVVCFGPKPKKK